MSCREILAELFSLGYFLSPVLGRGSPRHISRYKLAPCGHLLADNIKTEWLRSCVLRREEPAFVFSQFGDVREHGAATEKDLQEMFVTTKQFANGKAPFIVANIARELADNQEESNPSEPEEEDCSYYFRPSEFTSLRASLFVTPTGGQQMFYHWQSQRKYWWRKFSSNPGKISVSEDAPNKTVSIQIELPGGRHQVIETITNHGVAYLDPLAPDQREVFEIKDGRKRAPPYLIESCLSLEAAALMFLAESGGGSKVLKLHRRLAPYKVALLNSTDEELKSLSQYLYENLRQSHVFCLFTPMDPGVKSPTSLESQLSVNDRLGIPYSILVRDTALQDGLIGLRNRDTTLEERVHVSKVTDYVQSLLKNY